MMTVANRLKPGYEVPEDLERRTIIERNLEPTAPSAYFRWKNMADRGIALLFVVPVSLVIGVLVLVIRFTSRGPGIYRQRRIGKDGKPFTMFKLRSMRVDAELESGAIWAEEHDPRTTGVGKLLRLFHLDELPQIYNVLRGEMSFVGPRPERPEFVAVLSIALPDYADRLLVPPGVTGLAQINLPPDRNLKSVAEKLALDLEYVEDATLMLDVRLVLCTMSRMLKVFYPTWGNLFRVFRDGRRHPKYFPPDERLAESNGHAFSAAELESRLRQHFGAQIDLRLPSAYEALEGEGNGNGNGNGQGNGNGRASGGAARGLAAANARGTRQNEPSASASGRRRRRPR